MDLFPAGAASLVTASHFYPFFKAGVSVNDFYSSTLAINGTLFSPADITGVITLIPCLLPMEFYYVKPADRHYVCAELNAFLLYFISALQCDKCNPPDWSSLISDSVHRARWVNIALKLNIQLAPYRFKNGQQIHQDEEMIQKARRCTVIYDSVLTADCPPMMQQCTLLLARSLALPYLDCWFTAGGEECLLLNINTVPDISIPDNRMAIAAHFLKTI